MTTIAEQYGLKSPYPIVLTDTFVAGVECEIESIRGFEFSQRALWHVVPDQRLRNNGAEFCSAPLSREDLVKAFQTLHMEMVFSEGEPFSSRTSTHVHVNCQVCTFEEVRQILLLYALFEEFFFWMVKPERRMNIHCVPLSETTMSALYSKSVDTSVKSWHKYTALNLKRLSDLGTIEFRHLHGTNDSELFNQWLGVLEKTWLLGRTKPITRANLQNKEFIENLFVNLFQEVPKILELRPSLFNIIQNSLIDVKFAFV